MNNFPNFDLAIKVATRNLLDNGVNLRPNNWQSMDVSQRKDAETKEILNWSFQVPMEFRTHESYQADIKPNLPWADDHFIEERVSGEPKNPGETWKRWPWGLSANRFRTEGEQYSHSYAERYWPKWAGLTAEGLLNEATKGLLSHKGIRYRYGDLDDVVERLVQDPLTRQAVLSVWHPEDQHNGGQRVPCSLFYQFIQRNGELHMIYTIRSCDALRHFRDDIYLTVRLLLWVLDRLQKEDDSWLTVKPGSFTMHITSLHCFIGDVRALEKSV